MAHPDDRAGKLQELRDRIDQSLAQAERGEGVDGETFMQGLIDELDHWASHPPPSTP